MSFDGEKERTKGPAVGEQFSQELRPAGLASVATTQTADIIIKPMN
jgi:hypothetical protein